MHLIHPELSIEWLKDHATGNGVQLAVIDSGIDASHPDLQGAIAAACTVRLDIEDRPVYECLSGATCNDQFGHGTGVAGVIHSIAPDAQIVDVKVLDDRNSCTGGTLIAGIRWALDQNIPLINMSLATSKEKYYPEIFRLCEQAYVQQQMIVASRKNIGDLGCPAMYSSVISVAREDFQDPHRVVYRNQDMVEYAAHGTEVQVPKPGGGYVAMTGTSFATPHVTGIIALLLEVFPGLLVAEAKAVLKHFHEQALA